MRYFLDTEYNGFCGPLISIALVPEAPDAPPFYEALTCEKPTEWVTENVLPVLATTPISRDALVRRLAAYLGDDPAPVLVADWPEDIAHAAMMLIVGPGLRSAIDRIDFRLLDLFGFDANAASAIPHNAYHDALALRDHVLAREKGGWIS
jgi:hypothetical protein